MIVLDAYALAAMLADEPAAEEVGSLIAGESIAVPAPNLAEAADRLGRVHGIEVTRTRSALELLEQSTDFQVRECGRAGAWRAAALRVKHYHRSRRPLSLGDCLLLAAIDDDERLATSDPHVLDTAEEERIGWIALPDSQGRRHVPAR